MRSRGSRATISHEGVVQKIDNKSVTVIISASPACSGCHAEGSCSLAGKEEKSVIVRGSYDFRPGDTVDVIMNESLGLTAMFLGYLLPAIIVITLLAVLVASGVHELTAGLISLSSGIPYFLLLMAFKKAINEKFEFNIKLKE
jgi:positive regulator of sigma E activity